MSNPTIEPGTDYIVVPRALLEAILDDVDVLANLPNKLLQQIEALLRGPQ